MTTASRSTHAHEPTYHPRSAKLGHDEGEGPPTHTAALTALVLLLAASLGCGTSSAPASPSNGNGGGSGGDGDVVPDGGGGSGGAGGNAGAGEAGGGGRGGADLCAASGTDWVPALGTTSGMALAPVDALPVTVTSIDGGPDRRPRQTIGLHPETGEDLRLVLWGSSSPPGLLHVGDTLTLRYHQAPSTTWPVTGFSASLSRVGAPVLFVGSSEGAPMATANASLSGALEVPEGIAIADGGILCSGFVYQISKDACYADEHGLAVTFEGATVVVPPGMSRTAGRLTVDVGSFVTRTSAGCDRSGSLVFVGYVSPPAGT